MVGELSVCSRIAAYSCTVAQIAEALEETEEKIGRIVEVAQKYAPEYDERKILDEMMGLPKG